MRQPKRPKKFASAEAKRQWEEADASWRALKNKWADATLKSTVSAPAEKKNKKKKKVETAIMVLDERVTDVRKIKSKTDSVKGAVALKRSPMDARSLMYESPEIQKQTVIKSQSLMPMYNKGPAQYVTPEIDVTTIGAKSRRP